MKAIVTLLLIILTITLCGVFYIIGFIYALIRIIMIQRTFTINERARVRKFLELKHGSAISAVYAGY